MKKIYKYKLEPTRGMGQEWKVTMPCIHEVLKIGMDRNRELHIWIRFNPEGIDSTYLVKVFPTGAEVPDSFEHIKTVIEESGLVWHWFIQNLRNRTK